MRQAFALIGLCSMLPLTGPASATPPLEAYGKLPMIEDAAIAPDGARVAMIVTNGEQRNVAVFTARDLKLVLNVVAGNERVREIQWAGSRHIIVTVSSTSRVADVEGAKREWAVPLDVDLDARKVRPLLAGVDQGMNVILSKPMIRTVNGKPLAFIEGFYFREGLGRDSLFKFDFDTGQTTLVREGHDHTLDWLVDREGQPLAEDEFDADARKWRLRIRSGGGWSTAKLSADSIEHPVLAGLGRDGSSVLVGDSIDAKGGSTQQVLREIA
ncbi:MAG: S9 family peptidase, partial [Caulobacteraceae bacterium]